MADPTLYTSCAEVLSLCQSVKDDLETILDPETGFAPRLRKICRDQMEEYEEARMKISQEEMELLRMEESTWGLIQAVMPARKTQPLPLPTADQLLQENPFTPTATLAQAVMNASPLLSELVAIREWLQETAALPLPPEAATGYWKFTKYSVMQSLRTAAGNRDGLVKKMDPDVLSREDGRGLASDDANYEKRLVQALYGYLRAGRLEEAVDLCRKAHQPWRAASIRGSRLFQWRAITTETTAEDEGADPDEDTPSAGNRNRKLWKAACIRAALNPSLPDYERVLYAALAPTPQTRAVLMSACRTWEDHLWAQISIACEEKESSEMLRLSGSFWEGGLAAVEKGTKLISEDERAVEEGEWKKEVTAALDTLKTVDVADGPAADHAFHFSQLQIILDRTSSLLEVFAAGLRDGSYPQSSIEYPTMCRFFAHLALFLQMIDMPVPPHAMQIILEAYLQVLETAGQRELIAMYAGALGENAVERYALFLVSLDLSTDISERRLALTRARDHGLDMDSVAIVTAERTIEKAFNLLPPLKGPLPSTIALQPPPRDDEMFLLRSIEWTTFGEATYSTALEQANVILRYFLGSGKIHLAETLLDMLPPELTAFSEPEDQATEFLHYRQFFSIWQILRRVVDFQALEVSSMSQENKISWLSDYRGAIDQAHDLITKLLTTEWLVTDVEISGGGRRRRELIRIRQMYVPELIIRLHSTLFVSRHHIKENLKRALELVNIVADSRYKLYQDFVNEEGRRLADYLGAVRQAILGGLENGGSDPFRIMLA